MFAFGDDVHRAKEHRLDIDCLHLLDILSLDRNEDMSVEHEAKIRVFRVSFVCLNETRAEVKEEKRKTQAILTSIGVNVCRKRRPTARAMPCRILYPCSINTNKPKKDAYQKSGRCQRHAKTQPSLSHYTWQTKRQFHGRQL